MAKKCNNNYKDLPQKSPILARGHPPDTHHNTSQYNNNSNNLSDISSRISSDDEQKIMVRNNISICERDEPQIDASNTKSSRNIIPPTKKIFPPREKTK